MLLEQNPEVKVKNQEAEIDILSLFNSIVITLLKNKAYIIGTIVLGIAVGLTVFFISKPLYSSDMTGYSESLKIEVVEDIIEDLQRTLKDRDLNLAQKFLGLSKGKIESIQDISCRPAIEKSIYEKDESGIFVIEVKVSNVDVLDSLSKALEYYFQQNYYVKRKVALERYKITQLIKNIDIETKSLVELQVNMNEAIAKNTYRTNLFLSDIGYASTKLVELLDRRADLENRLQVLEELKILKNFVKFNKRTSPRLLKSLIYGEVLCFFILIVFASIKMIFVYLLAMEKKASSSY